MEFAAIDEIIEISIKKQNIDVILIYLKSKYFNQKLHEYAGRSVIMFHEAREYVLYFKDHKHYNSSLNSLANVEYLHKNNILNPVPSINIDINEFISENYPDQRFEFVVTNIYELTKVKFSTICPSSLYLAIINRNEILADELIERKIGLHYINYERETPLMKAIRYGLADIALKLASYNTMQIGIFNADALDCAFIFPDMEKVRIKIVEEMSDCSKVINLQGRRNYIDWVVLYNDTKLLEKW